MKAAILTLGVLALGATGAYSDKTFSETHPCYTDAGCTDSAPTFSDAGVASAGALLYHVDSFRGLLCANPGQTLGTSGTLAVFYCDHHSLLCYQNKQLSQALASATDGTSQCVAFPDVPVGVPSEEYGDTVEFVPQAVSVNGAQDGGPLLERVYVHFGNGK